MILDVLKQQGLGLYVTADIENSTISFKLQNGPIKEVGENGCQIDALIYIATIIIKDLNNQFPCRENSLAITKLEEASHWLDARKKDRDNRGVEGLNKE